MYRDVRYISVSVWIVALRKQIYNHSMHKDHAPKWTRAIFFTFYWWSSKIFFAAWTPGEPFFVSQSGRESHITVLARWYTPPRWNSFRPVLSLIAELISAGKFCVSLSTYLLLRTSRLLWKGRRTAFVTRKPLQISTLASCLECFRVGCENVVKMFYKIAFPRVRPILTGSISVIASARKGPLLPLGSEPCRTMDSYHSTSKQREWLIAVVTGVK